ncbi:MAG: hypothetical protein ACRCW0_04460 [Clostridium sp.]
MEMLISVLNDIGHVENIIKEFNENGICGATIIDSTGMAEVLSTMEEEVAMFGSLKLFLNQGTYANKTIFTVLEEKKIQLAVDIINKVVGNLSKPGGGIIFTIPVNRVIGINKE